MNNSRFWLAAAIIAALILIGFVLSVPHARNTPAKTPLAETVATSTPLVILHDVYKKGTHAFTGALQAPNPCTTATATSSLLGTASTSQSILISVFMPTDTGICLQQPATTTFETGLAAPKDLPITVTVNDQTATTTP